MSEFGCVCKGRGCVYCGFPETRLDYSEMESRSAVSAERLNAVCKERDEYKARCERLEAAIRDAVEISEAGEDPHELLVSLLAEAETRDSEGT